MGILIIGLGTTFLSSIRIFVHLLNYSIWPMKNSFHPYSKATSCNPPAQTTFKHNEISSLKLWWRVFSFESVLLNWLKLCYGSSFWKWFHEKNWINPVRESHAISKQKKLKLEICIWFLLLSPRWQRMPVKGIFPWSGSLQWKRFRGLAVWRKANSNLSTNRCNFFHQFYDFVHH